MSTFAWSATAAFACAVAATVQSFSGCWPCAGLFLLATGCYLMAMVNAR